MELKNLEKFIETLFYGSDFASYNSGINIKNIVPEMHYRIFGFGFVADFREHSD